MRIGGAKIGVIVDPLVVGPLVSLDSSGGPIPARDKGNGAVGEIYEERKLDGVACDR